MENSNLYAKTCRNLTPVHRHEDISSMSIDMKKSHPVHRHEEISSLSIDMKKSHPCP
ncbi:hypothetical protein DPMN_088174 [Dreissena polymorpha]|uniref:Uncharacterized protein n=1 Tax=Dreissena polymorpha TaxID=45954 RepID=A0A9D4KUK6_DREPO|nr:hypothetical protein DPMN_088174 [Dreissena polymorpha]